MPGDVAKWSVRGREKRCTTIHPYRLETCQMSPVVLQPLQQIPAKVAAVEIDQDL